MCESVWFQATDQWWIDADRPVHVSMGRLRVSIDLAVRLGTHMYVIETCGPKPELRSKTQSRWLTNSTKKFHPEKSIDRFSTSNPSRDRWCLGDTGKWKNNRGTKKRTNSRFVMRQWWYLSFWRTSILHFNVLQNNALIGIHTKIAHPLLSRVIECIHSLEQIKTESGLKGQ